MQKNYVLRSRCRLWEKMPGARVATKQDGSETLAIIAAGPVPVLLCHLRHRIYS